MDFNSAAGVYTELKSARPVSCVRVGDMKSKVESTVSDLRIDDVFALRRLVVALSILRSHGLPAQGNHISFDDMGAPHQSHRVCRFQDDDTVYRLSR